MLSVERQQLTYAWKQSLMQMQCLCVVVKFNCHVSTSLSSFIDSSVSRDLASAT